MIACSRQRRQLPAVRLAVTSLLLVTAAISDQPAVAQAPAAPASDTGIAEAARMRAQEHLNRGNDLFTADRFMDALIEFQAAYAAFPSPKLHFNMGQCQRALGRLPAALNEFRRFVEETQDVAPDLRLEAERYIAELKSAEAKQGSIVPATTEPTPRPGVLALAAQTPPVAPPPPPLVTPPLPSDDGGDPPVYKRWWFWTAVGVVAAGATVGVWLLTREPPCTHPGPNCL